jgi:hypothetical protein
VGVLQGLERIQSGLCEKIDFLRGYGGKSKMNKVFDNICRAFKNHDIDGAKKLIAHSNVNDPIGVYGSILILTISCDSICTLDFIDHLIDIGVDINAVDSDNETALYTAIRYYRYDVILRLLKCGARFGTISTRTYGSEIDEAIDESSRTRDAEMVIIFIRSSTTREEREPNERTNRVIYSMLISGLYPNWHPQVQTFRVVPTSKRNNTHDRWVHHKDSKGSKVDYVKKLIF